MMILTVPDIAFKCKDNGLQDGGSRAQRWCDLDLDRFDAVGRAAASFHRHRRRHHHPLSQIPVPLGAILVVA